MMRAKHIEDGLALVGALIVLVGVSFAAENALAEETADTTTAAVVIDDTANNTLRGAEIANTEAAAKAAESLEMDTLVDLDFKFDDRTSMLVAGND